MDFWVLRDYVEQATGGSTGSTLPDAALSTLDWDVLEGFESADWLSYEKERVRLIARRALLLHARALAMHGELDKALRVFERLLATDPLDEETCRDAMKTSWSMGRTTEALRLYASLSQKLRGELATVPDRETNALYDAIRASRSSVTDPRIFLPPKEERAPGPKVEMVGRQYELMGLVELLSRASQGKVTVVGIEGEAGIGKTRLIGEFLKAISHQKCVVLGGVCEEVPKAKAYDAFRKLITVSSAGSPGTPTESPVLLSAASAIRFPDPNEFAGRRGDLSVQSEARARFFELIATWVHRNSASEAMVIVIEDVQYIDIASLDLLDYLIRQVTDCMFMLVLSWRTAECPPRIARFVASKRVQTIFNLGRLTEVEIQQLCGGILDPAPSAPIVAHIHRESEGNPLFALEILKVLGQGSVRAQGLTANSKTSVPFGGFGRGRLSSIPPGMQESLRRRLLRLPRGSMRVLQFACCSGRRLNLSTIERAMRCDPKVLRRSLEALVRAGFIGEAGGGYEFVHEKVREFCYRCLTEATRLGVHRRLLHVLERSPKRLDDLAYHSEQSGCANKASAYWEELGDQANDVWAHQDAVAAYTRAIENLPRTSVARPPVRIFSLFKKRALAWEFMGEMEKGEQDIREMLALASKAGDELLSSEALAFQSRLLLRRGLFRQAIGKAQEAVALATHAGDSSLESRAKEMLALGYFRAGLETEARQLFVELIPILEQIQDHESLERVWSRLGFLQAGAGDMGAILSLETAERYWTGNLNERGVRHLQRGLLSVHLGRGEEARVSFQLAEADFRRAGNASGQALVNSILSLVCTCSGDLVGALKHARRGLPFKAGKTEAYWMVVSSTNICHGTLLVLGNVSLAKRMTAKVLERVPQVWGRGRGSLLDLAAAIAFEEGNFDLARTLAKDALQAADSGPPVTRGGCLLTLGCIDLASGETRKAIESLGEAVGLFEKKASYLELTSALSHLALALMADGQVDEALAISRKSVEALTSHGEFAFRPQEIYWNHFQVLDRIGDPMASTALGRAYRIVTRGASQLGGKLRNRYLSSRVNRSIVDVWERRHGGGGGIRPLNGELAAKRLELAEGRRAIACVPRSGAPWGRPLRAEDLVDVILTIDAGRPDERLEETDGEVGLRRARILRLCAEANVQGGDMREEDLARVLGVSTRTVRADIAYLRARGCHLQTRGATMH